MDSSPSSTPKVPLVGTDLMEKPKTTHMEVSVLKGWPIGGRKNSSVFWCQNFRNMVRKISSSPQFCPEFKFLKCLKLIFPSPFRVWGHAGAGTGLLEPGFSRTGPSHPTSSCEHTAADWSRWGSWEFGVLSGWGTSSSGSGGKNSWLGDTLRVCLDLATQSESVDYFYYLTALIL